MTDQVFTFLLMLAILGIGVVIGRFTKHCPKQQNIIGTVRGERGRFVSMKKQYANPGTTILPE